MSSPADRYAAWRDRSRSTLAEFAAGLPFQLDPFQVEACAALEGGRGVLVAAPTGAGKTVVGEFAVHLALAQGQKAFYTTPIKALSNQKYADLARRYGPERVGLLTGDTTLNGEAPVVVMTTEVLRNMLYAGSTTVNGLGFVVMDEVHYLADLFRGPVWEEVIIHLSDSVQLVSLSATVSNAEEFGDWLTTVRGDTAVVVSERRPVPLWQHVMTRDGMLDLYAGHVDPTAPGPDPPINPELRAVLSAPGRPQRGRGRPDRRPTRPIPRFAVVDVLDQRALLPAIYFVFSRAGCDAAVDQCVGAGLRLTTDAEAAQIAAIVAQRCGQIPAADLGVLGYLEWSRALERGIAAHHAGLLPLFKETVEELFTRGLVKVVFATETLALGINMPARSVVLDRLTKWDGAKHADITPGEYTQLTGRAGRRGIDVEGHAVVVEHGRLDPVALAGLASRRTYPLRSSFRPTYNMAVNLVAQVGRERAREVLETSFAQFQADRAVVGLARQAQSHTEALEGYAAAMTCHLGDFAEYWDLRRRLRDQERGQARSDPAAVRDGMRRLRRGDVVEIPSGRRAGHAVVVEVRDALDGPTAVVVTADRHLRTLRAKDLPTAPRQVATVRVPKRFTARSPVARRDLAAAMHSALAGRTVRPAKDQDAIADLRRELRSHPCHGCAEREEHARWAERRHRLSREHESLLRRIEGRTSSIARLFDRVCEVLTATGYLGDGVTAAGRTLRGLYAESDLLVAECLRSGSWRGLRPAELAAVVSAVVYSARGEEQGPWPSGPGRLGQALDATQRVWARLEELERRYDVPVSRRPDAGLATAIHRWGSGRSLGAVLEGDLAAGDFVRWCKQVIDLLDQIAGSAEAELRTTARAAVAALRRGVVAQSAV